MRPLFGESSPGRFWLTLGLLIAVVVVYFPGLHGPFAFDDEIHIVNDPSIRISKLNLENLRTVVSPDDGLSLTRPLSRMTLAINYYLAGGNQDAFGYKLTNVGIHLINTLLVYWLALLLIKRHESVVGGHRSPNTEWIALLAAGAWSIHPLHLTSVLYVVQRMTSLAALCVFAGTIAYLYGRQRVHEHRKHGYLLMTLGAIGGSMLGFAFKENAVVLLPLLLVVELIFFRMASEATSDQRHLKLFYGLIILVPLFAAGLWMMTHPRFVLDAYVAREFTLTERLLTQPRVLWFYASLLFFPDIRRFSLFHDDIPISTGLLHPWTTLPAILALATIVVVAFLVRRKYPLVGFAILWYLIGHGIESTFIGLEIAHEHRNYLPDFAIVLASTHGLFALAARFRRPVRHALLVAPLIVLGLVTAVRANHWASDEGIIGAIARYHPSSARGQYMLAELYAEKMKDLASALEHYARAAALAPHEAGYRIKFQALIARLGSGDDQRFDSKGVLSKESESIRQQLANQPVPASTVHTLEQLVGCINDTPGCKSLYADVREWYLAVIQNPVVSNRDRARFVVHLFNLATARHDLDLALQAVRSAQRLAPTDMTYRLMEANVYMLKSELDTAERLLLDIKATRPDIMTKENRENLEFLLAETASQRAGRGTNPLSPN